VKPETVEFLKYVLEIVVIVFFLWLVFGHPGVR